MKSTDILARAYDNLTPEERFRLIVAAAGRGDEVEQQRLIRAGRPIVLHCADYAPYAHAYRDVALFTFIELVDEARRFFDAIDRLRESEADVDDEIDDETDEEPEEDSENEATWYQSLDLALAAGYVLRTKVDGWKLFCERMSIPPFLVWEGLPGFDRLSRAMQSSERCAFVPEGFLRWLNSVRPAEEPELTHVPLTIESFAESLDEAYRDRVWSWSG